MGVRHEPRVEVRDAHAECAAASDAAQRRLFGPLALRPNRYGLQRLGPEHRPGHHHGAELSVFELRVHPGRRRCTALRAGSRNLGRGRYAVHGRRSGGRGGQRGIPGWPVRSRGQGAGCICRLQIRSHRTGAPDHPGHVRYLGVESVQSARAASPAGHLVRHDLFGQPLPADGRPAGYDGPERGRLQDAQAGPDSRPGQLGAEPDGSQRAHHVHVEPGRRGRSVVRLAGAGQLANRPLAQVHRSRRRLARGPGVSRPGCGDGAERHSGLPRAAVQSDAGAAGGFGGRQDQQVRHAVALAGWPGQHHQRLRAAEPVRPGQRVGGGARVLDRHQVGYQRRAPALWRSLADGQACPGVGGPDIHGLRCDLSQGGVGSDSVSVRCRVARAAAERSGARHPGYSRRLYRR